MHLRRFGTLATVLGVLVTALLLGVPGTICAEPLVGAIGLSSQWGSGWIDLAVPVTFAKGERLRLSIGGSAEKIVVRLLPKGQSPDTPSGIVGAPIDVPKTRVVEFTIPEERKQITQISVHGGSNPWGKFPLGRSNGPATITSAERLKP